MNFLIYVYVLVTMVIADSIWLFSTGTLYRTWLGHLFAPTFNFIPAIFFYLLYGFGVVYFVISPAFRAGTSLTQLFISGALFGLIAYATYDLTNNATLRNWPLQVTFIDMAWGTFLTGLVSVVALTLYKHFK